MLLWGIYLFLCCILGNSVLASDENAIGFGSSLILLTAPWSYWLAKLFPFNDHTFLLILAAGALINAIILYFVGLLITRMLRFLSGRKATPQL